MWFSAVTRRVRKDEEYFSAITRWERKDVILCHHQEGEKGCGISKVKEQFLQYWGGAVDEKQFYTELVK
ncbi:hypothetical protein M5K25_003682 [Dendrobium thyrsiflorum]|uniref:Uncharacterized protein n=1 Tax=Dendrobium thyrsiflorum TaxID=117978 RepID=A0ABD0VJN7_DENTH